jgi:hypothetical protein
MPRPCPASRSRPHHCGAADLRIGANEQSLPCLQEARRRLRWASPHTPCKAWRHRRARQPTSRHPCRWRYQSPTVPACPATSSLTAPDRGAAASTHQAERPNPSRLHDEGLATTHTGRRGRRGRCRRFSYSWPSCQDPRRAWSRSFAANADIMLDDARGERRASQSSAVMTCKVAIFAPLSRTLVVVNLNLNSMRLK